MDKWIGKTAIVTGASSGIGAAIAVSLAKAGVNVVGLARRKDRVEALAAQTKDAKGTIHALVCDVSDPKSIDAAFETIERKFGKVHILINNAGMWRSKLLTSDELKDEDILDTINTNLTGLVLCSRKACKLMKKGGEPGYIINVNSIVGQVNATKAMVDFGINVLPATKHAVTNVTEVLRLELASNPKNSIRVSSISPGRVSTEAYKESSVHDQTFEQVDPLKPEDIADATIYLLSTSSTVNVTELTIIPANDSF